MKCWLVESTLFRVEWSAKSSADLAEEQSPRTCLLVGLPEGSGWLISLSLIRITIATPLITSRALMSVIFTLVYEVVLGNISRVGALQRPLSDVIHGVPQVLSLESRWSFQGSTYKTYRLAPAIKLICIAILWGRSTSEYITTFGAHEPCRYEALF